MQSLTVPARQTSQIRNNEQRKLLISTCRPHHQLQPTTNSSLPCLVCLDCLNKICDVTGLSCLDCLFNICDVTAVSCLDCLTNICHVNVTWSFDMMYPASRLENFRFLIFNFFREWYGEVRIVTNMTLISGRLHTTFPLSKLNKNPSDNFDLRSLLGVIATSQRSDKFSPDFFSPPRLELVSCIHLSFQCWTDFTEIFLLSNKETLHWVFFKLNKVANYSKW